MAPSAWAAGWLFAPAAAYAALCALMLVRPDSRDQRHCSACRALCSRESPLPTTLTAHGWCSSTPRRQPGCPPRRVRILREPRFRLAALGFTAVTVGHVLAFDARPDGLFVAHDPAGGLSACSSPGGSASSLLGLELRRRYATRPDDAVRNEAYTKTAHDLEELLAPASVAALWLAGVAAVYASSLALLSIDFEKAQPAVSGLWAVVGLACVASLAWRPVLRIGGLAFLLAAAVKVLAYDIGHLDTTGRAVSLIVVGGVWALAGFADQRLERREAPDWPSMSLLLVGAAFVAAGTVEWGGEGWLLAPAGAFAVLWGAAFLREDERDFAGLTAAISLLFAGIAAAALLDGTWLVLAWTAAAAGLAGLSAATHEPRFRAGALAFLALGLGHALAFDARPDGLFSASEHPGSGAPALLAVVVAAIVVAIELARTEGYRSVSGGSRRSRFAREQGRDLRGGCPRRLRAVAVDPRAGGALSHRGRCTRISRRGTPASAPAGGSSGSRCCTSACGAGRPACGSGASPSSASASRRSSSTTWRTSAPSTRALSFLAVGAVLLAGGLLYQRLAGESERPAM